MGFIAGHLGGQPAPQLLRAAAREAARRLAHRGPHPGQAPAHLRWGGQDAVLLGEMRGTPRHRLAFDGRLTNAAALADELRALGQPAEGAADADIVLAAWQAWGPGMLPRLEGAFALAVLDSEAGTALLARDRFGERPLLVARTTLGAWAFASDLRGALAWPGLSRAPDLDVLAHILAFGHAPIDATPMAGLRRLRPGHSLAIGADGQASESRWWAPPPPACADDAPRGEAGAALSDAMLHRVRAAQADATGAHGHGGDGASVLAACLSRLGVAMPPPAPLPDPAAALVQRLILCHGEPFQPEALLPCLAAGAAGGRVLAPAGAAELTLAHRRYRLFARAVARLDNPARHRADDQAAAFHEGPLTARDLWHAASGAPHEAARLQVSGPALIHTLVLAAPDAYGASLEETPADALMATAAHLDLTLRLPARDLAALDTAAAMTGATFLCPMLDSALVASIAPLPDAARLWLMPPASVPAVDLEPWHPMGPALRDFTEETLLGQTCRQRDLFSHGAMEALVQRHRVAPGADTALLWSLLGIELWCRGFLDTDGTDAEPARELVQEGTA